jgi:hypothetical protein
MRLSSVIAIILFLSSCRASEVSYRPTEGMVPDSESAIKIAEILWHKVYGDLIYQSRPFTATLNGDVWFVTGTVHTTRGGAPILELRKKDCKVLRMIHEK